MPVFKPGALHVAASSLKHRVSVEVKARANDSIRSALSQREESLESSLLRSGTGANSVASSLRASLSWASQKFRSESSMTEAMIDVRSSANVQEHSSSGKRNAADVENEINMMRAAKKVANIDIHMLSLTETESSLHTDLSKGLSDADAAARLQRDGPNKLTPPKQTPWWVKLLLHFVDGFQIVLIGCAALSIIAGSISTPIDQPSINLGCVLVIVTVCSSLFAYSQEAKSDKVMEGFNALTPSRCRVLRGGIVVDCAAEELVIGDIVELQFGEKVPADLRIIQTSNLKVDNSSLTGEPEPLKRTVECTHESAMESKNIAFFGTFFVEGSGRGVVFQVGDFTFLGTIAQAALFAKQPTSTLKREVEHFVKTMSFVAIFQGLILFLVALFSLKLSFKESLILGIGLLVGNVPEGLLPTLTILLTLCARRMKDINVLVKTLDVMETLGCTTCIASDKTGTLTQNKMSVSHLYYGGAIHNSGGNAVSGSSYTTFSASDACFAALQRCATVCNRAVFVLQPGQKLDANSVSRAEVHGDASESALVKFCQPIADVSSVRDKYKVIASIPFNSTNKWQLSIHATGSSSQPHVLLIKGAPERILKMCSHAVSRAAAAGSLAEEVVPLDASAVEAANFELGSRGERVLAFAQLFLDPAAFPLGFAFDTDVINFPLTGLHFCGLVSLIDPPRAGVAEAVLTCQRAGIKVVMVTGDHPVTARAIARSVNIMPGETREERALRTGQQISAIDKESIECIVVAGNLLEEYKEEDWTYALSRKQIVFARTMPQQKQEIVSRLQEMGHVVAVTGDGVNDAPALKKADIGLAMGIVGSDVAKEAAKVILMDDNFASIVNGIAAGRLIFDNLQKCIIYVLTHITPEFVPFVLFAIFPRIPLTVEVMMILVIDLGTDMIPAIALAYEEMEGIVMEKPPRSTVTDRLASWRLWLMGYVWRGGLLTALCFFTFFGILSDWGFTPSSLTNSAAGFGGVGNREPFNYLKLAIELDKCSSLCNSSAYDMRSLIDPVWKSRPIVSQVLCIPSLPCVANCPRLRFFCDMASNNQVWNDPLQSEPYYSRGKDFSDYRVDALASAQSGYLFTIVLGQFATMLCVKTRFVSLFKAGMKNFYINVSFPISLAVICLVVFAPFCQSFFLTASFNGKFVGYVICLLPVPVLGDAAAPRLFGPTDGVLNRKPRADAATEQPFALALVLESVSETQTLLSAALH